MSLFLTLIAASLLILLSIILLGIGRLFTGKSKLHAGMCGRTPEEKKSQNCDKKLGCSLCHKEENR